MSDAILDALSELKAGQERIEKKVDQLREDFHDYRRATTDNFATVTATLEALVKGDGDTPSRYATG